MSAQPTASTLEGGYDHAQLRSHCRESHPGLGDGVGGVPQNPGGIRTSGALRLTSSSASAFLSRGTLLIRMFLNSAPEERCPQGTRLRPAAAYWRGTTKLALPTVR